MTGISGPGDNLWQEHQIHVEEKFQLFAAVLWYDMPWLGSPCFGNVFSQIHYTTRSSPSLYLFEFPYIFMRQQWSTHKPVNVHGGRNRNPALSFFSTAFDYFGIHEQDHGNNPIDHSCTEEKILFLSSGGGAS
ncbi:MAG: hypothetical protein WC952_02975 [Desulfobulbaceae bacterium]